MSTSVGMSICMIGMTIVASTRPRMKSSGTGTATLSTITPSTTSAAPTPQDAQTSGVSLVDLSGPPFSAEEHLEGHFTERTGEHLVDRLGGHSEAPLERSGDP